MIVTTFCIAVLANIEAVGYLKDVVLIVIGFYFGTRARRAEDGSLPRAPQAPPGPSPPEGAPLPDSHSESSYQKPTAHAAEKPELR